MEVNKEIVEEIPIDEATLGGLGDSISYYLEYKFDSKYGDNITFTLKEP